jgi:hypothetical protein
MASRDETREAFDHWERENYDPRLTLWEAWEARGRYDALVEGNKTCGRCHGPYMGDTVVPSEIWNQIADPSDYWCTRCIDEAIAALGLSAPVEVEWYFAGKGIVSKLYAS